MGDEVEVLHVVENLHRQEMRMARQRSTEDILSVCFKQCILEGQLEKLD